MEKLIIRNSITIHAPVTNVWDALTNPEQTKKYMFGCDALSDWKPGSILIWKMIHEGNEFIPVKGNIVDIRPNTFLSYTTFDPHSTLADVPENYLTVTYELVEEKGNTVFTVTQGDYNQVGDGKRRYEEAYNHGEGWNSILIEIKKVAESTLMKA